MRSTWLATAITIAVISAVSDAGIAQDIPGQETARQEVRYGQYGPYSEFGSVLDAHGVRVRAELRDEYASNPIGGVKQGDNNYGWFHFNLALDLHKIVGLKNGYIHVTTLRDYGGGGLSMDYSGTYTKVQEAYKNNYDIWRLGVLSYEQYLFNNKLNINLGRLGTTSFYGRLQEQCYSMSGLTCTVPQILNTSSGYTFPTSATWTANVRYRILPHVRIEGGAFEIDKYIQDTSGFRDFGDSNATGVMVSTEVDVGDFNLQEARYPNVFKVGAYRNTSPIPDLFYNTKGQSLGLYGGTARTSTAVRGGYYAMDEKTVWRPGERSNENVTLFSGYIQPTEKEEVMLLQTWVGSNWHAPLASRPHDVIDFTANYYRVNPKEIDFLHDSRVKAGGFGTNRPNEVVLEFGYSALASPTIRLAPNLQYYFHPDNVQIPKTSVLPKNMLVLGVRLDFDVGSWLKMPHASDYAQ